MPGPYRIVPGLARNATQGGRNRPRKR
jgi:hypothetical protein